MVTLSICASQDPELSLSETSNEMNTRPPPSQTHHFHHPPSLTPASSPMLLSINLQPLQQGLFAIGLLTLFSFVPAQARLIICNATGEAERFAIQQWDSSNNGWTSKGWYRLGNGSCEDVISDGPITKDIFIHMEGTNHSENDTIGCVSNGAFETLWDGDLKNPFYIDIGRSTRFKRCNDISRPALPPYRRVGFHSVNRNSKYIDNCVVIVDDYYKRDNGQFLGYSKYCWDD